MRYQQNMAVVLVFKVAEGIDKFFLSTVVLLIESTFCQVVDNEKIDSIAASGIGKYFQQSIGLGCSGEFEHPKTIRKPLVSHDDFSTFWVFSTNGLPGKTSQHFPRLKLQRGNAYPDSLAHGIDGDMSHQLGFSVAVYSVNQRQLSGAEFEITVQRIPRAGK